MKYDKSNLHLASPAGCGKTKTSVLLNPDVMCQSEESEFINEILQSRSEPDHRRDSFRMTADFFFSKPPVGCIDAGKMD